MKQQPSSHADWVAAALERYEAPLIRYAARFTGSAETARDVVQDTFLKLCRADRRKVEDRLAAWLYTVCRNRALDVRKKERRMTPVSDDVLAAQAHGHPGPDAVAVVHEEQRMLLDALTRLPEAEQEAFRLKFQDGLTYREISQVMGKSLGTVSNLMGRAVNAVRLELMPPTGAAGAVEEG